MKKLILTLSLLLSVFVISGRSVYAQEKIYADETTSGIFNEAISTAYGYFTSGNIIEFNTFSNSDAINGYAEILTSHNIDRYSVKLDANTYGMLYVGPNNKHYWYFGELKDNLRHGKGFTILIDSNVYKVFNGIYENDFPKGYGEYAFILLDNLEYWCMKGNFNGMLLNGSYNIVANHPTLGQTNISLTYKDNHLANQTATFVENGINYSLDINIENNSIVYSSVENKDYNGTKNLKIPEGYELMSIVAYPAKNRIYWLYDSLTETNNGYEIFLGKN